MSAKFVGILDTLGRDFKKGLDFVLPWAATAGETAVSIYAPQLSPLFNITVSAVVTAEQNFAAIGKQSGTGASKLASVIAIAGGLIKQFLTDAGMESDDAAVINYINSVVTILNATPTPAALAAAA